MSTQAFERGGESGAAPAKLDRFASVTANYDAIFCDVWGVVHNGVAKHPAAEAALAAARKAGCKVVLLTNSPRPSAGVIAQLDGLGVSREAYDAVVTSGDATRMLIDEARGRIFHLGAERDLDIYKGLDVDLVGEDEASVVVATGLFDDESETPDDYKELLGRFLARSVPMICANPDIVVHRGERLIFCAGALARDYEESGGKVLLAGKPHRPIYDLARRVLGLSTDARVLAVGDGLLTDVKGANDFGVDVLLITHGIHTEEFVASAGDEATPTPEKVASVLAARSLQARYFMTALA